MYVYFRIFRLFLSYDQTPKTFFLYLSSLKSRNLMSLLIYVAVKISHVFFLHLLYYERFFLVIRKYANKLYIGIYVMCFPVLY